jgi:Membrane proteins related to metalloendopeptidases
MSRVLKTKKNQITGAYKSGVHNGVDLVGEGSTLDTIIAHCYGTVIWIQMGRVNNINTTGDDTYGNAVKIRHSNGYTTLYAHLKDVYVKVGDNVREGQDIGYMGDSGRAYGAHLHFEVRTSDSYSTITNPTPYLDSNLPGIINNNYINNEVVGQWQRVMNITYNLGLAEDKSFGPLSQKVSLEKRLWWRNPEMNNEYVRWIQHRLNLLGILGKDGRKLNEDGYFGENSDWAVREYQKARLITNDGVVGRYTVEWLLKDKY